MALVMTMLDSDGHAVTLLMIAVVTFAMALGFVTMDAGEGDGREEGRREGRMRKKGGREKSRRVTERGWGRKDGK